KKVRTIAIRPDQPVVADAMPQAAPPVAAAASARPQAPTAKSAVPAARPAADNSTPDADTDSNSPAVAPSVLPARHAAQAPPDTPRCREPRTELPRPPGDGLRPHRPSPPLLRPSRPLLHQAPTMLSVAAASCRFRRSAARMRPKPRSAVSKLNIRTCLAGE